MHAVILERNKLVGRRVARLFMATGATATSVDDPALVAEAIEGADVLCADTFDGDLLVEQLRSRPGLRGVLWTAEPLKRSLRYVLECEMISDVLGRRDFESPPRTWEILMTARRLSRGGQTKAVLPRFDAYLDWGYTGRDHDVGTAEERDAVIADLDELVGMLHLPNRLAEMFGELAHELMMNAMYGAPIDEDGQVKYASDRKAELVLEGKERVAVQLGTDGSRLVIQVRDQFGRLLRDDVISGLARGLAGGEIDRSHGGAGLGLLLAHLNSSVLIYDVAPNVRTEVTAVLDLDLNLRELRTQARSLHFWSR